MIEYSMSHLRRFLTPGCRLVALLLTLLMPTPSWSQTHIDENGLRAHLAFLADDLLEGRGTGQRGGDIAAHYLATQAALIGLKPLLINQDNNYFQAVQLVGSKTLSSSSISFQAEQQNFQPALGPEVLLGTSNGDSKVRVDAPVVFVGYGVTAKEERWDDYKGVDVRGKILIMMVNDPQPTAQEPQRFDGAAMTYYGRWIYKFEEAARRGAAGVLLIHTLASATYGWNVSHTSFSHERFSLAGGGNPVEGWLTEESARHLFKMANLDLDLLRERAEHRDFQPVALNSVQAHVQMDNQVRQIEQNNVIGIVPGTDPQLKSEALVYSAHWDHLGKIEHLGQAPEIWNGAVDNASGAAALLAMAQLAVHHPAKRTQIFLWPCAEEQALLGSLYFVRHSPWPIAKIVADLNLDSMNFVGKTQDIGVAGSERSSLFQSASSVAKKMHLKIAPGVPDLGGAYFRADHFNFARFGIPAFNVGSAVFSGDGHFDYVEDANTSLQKMKHFKEDYHTIRDRYDPAWDLSGMTQQAQFTLNLGYAVANAKQKPVWRKGDPYGEIKP